MLEVCLCLLFWFVLINYSIVDKPGACI